MQLRKRALGLSLGVVWGLFICIATLWATARGHGKTLSLLKGYYVGYGVSYLGALVGLAWGVVHGFVAGVLVAWLYDVFCKLLYKSEEAAG